MPRVAPAFDPAALRTDEMRDGDVINLDVGAILAHCPEASAGLAAAMDALRAKGTIGQRAFELIRLRIAFHNQCRSCMAIRYRTAVDDGLTEGLVCSLEKPSEAPDPSAASTPAPSSARNSGMPRSPAAPPAASRASPSADAASPAASGSGSRNRTRRPDNPPAPRPCRTGTPRRRGSADRTQSPCDPCPIASA